MITFSNKSTSLEYFNDIHKASIDGISNKMTLLSDIRRYDDIYTIYEYKMGYYVVMIIY